MVAFLVPPERLVSTHCAINRSAPFLGERLVGFSGDGAFAFLQLLRARDGMRAPVVVACSARVLQHVKFEQVLVISARFVGDSTFGPFRATACLAMRFLEYDCRD